MNNSRREQFAGRPIRIALGNLWLQVSQMRARQIGGVWLPFYGS